MYSREKAYQTRYAFVLVVLLNMCLTEEREREREGGRERGERERGEGERGREGDGHTDRVKVGALIIDREHGWQM